MSRMNRTLAIFALSVAAVSMNASSILAHEGHGHPDHQDGVSHYVVNPSHALPIMIGAVVLIAGCVMLVRALRSRGEN